MSNARYVHAFVQTTPILNHSGTQYGTLLSEYEVREYWDMRNAVCATPGTGIAAQAVRAYVISLRQRLTISNGDANSFTGLPLITSYDNYPILAVQQVAPSSTPPNALFYLEDYSPKTLNATVNTSANAATSADQGTSVQRTSGSSTAVTNSYEVSASAGFFGEALTGGVSAGFGHSETDTTEQSVTKGQSTSLATQAGTGSAMSIKDWASYAFLDASKVSPSWVWGQEYPWNVINFRSTNSGQIVLPGYVSALLCDGTTVYPPSNISQFGPNFVAHAKWVFCSQGAVLSQDETLTFKHSITYWEGSHKASGSSASPTTASIAIIANAQPIDSVTLNLPVLALDPITEAGAGNGAVVGFAKSEFISPPGSAAFRIKSGANNVYVSGSGFDALANPDSVLTASHVSSASPVTLAIQFKVTDPRLELSLFFKHWLTTAVNCQLTIQVNGYTIVRYVDAPDAGSGSDNLTIVTLRKRDYTAQDFFDYLVVGLNEIVVTIAPVSPSPCGYSLRALAIQ